MPNAKTASLIIPTYNRMDLLTQTLRSVSKSTTSTSDIEVIIVDDGSSDHTFDAVRSFSSDLNLKYIFQPDDGFRLSRAKNIGLATSVSDICVFIDSGIVIPSWFIASHLKAHSEFGPSFVLGNILGFDYNDKNTEMLTEEMNGRNIDDLVLDWETKSALKDPREPAWRQCEDDLMRLPAPWALAWGGNISVHRELLQPAIKFDEHYRSWGAEDQDFALSLYNRGANFVLSRAASAIHVPHPKSETSNDMSVLRNKEYLHSKYKMKETELLVGMRAVPLNAHLAQEYSSQNLQG